MSLPVIVNFTISRLYLVSVIISADSSCLHSASDFRLPDCLATTLLFDFHWGRPTSLAVPLKPRRRYGMRMSVWSVLKWACLQRERILDKGVGQVAVELFICKDVHKGVSFYGTRSTENTHKMIWKYKEKCFKCREQVDRVIKTLGLLRGIIIFTQIISTYNNIDS